MTDPSRPPVIDPRFGRKLRQLRVARGLSQTILAARTHYSKGHIGNLERHRRSPTAQVAARLDAVLQAHGELEALLPVVPLDDEEEAMTPSQFAQDVAAHLLKNGFADLVADKVAERVDFDLAPNTLRGWHREYIFPAWSGYCFDGDHSACDGSAPPSEKGCHCPCHSGEPLPEFGYRLRIDDHGRLYAEARTKPRPSPRKLEPDE